MTERRHLIKDTLRNAGNKLPIWFERDQVGQRRGLGDVMFPGISKRDRKTFGVEPPPSGF